VQSKNTLITRKQADLGESTYVYFSKTLDTLAGKKGWIFVKEGGAYLAVKPATGGYRWLSSAKNKASDKDQRYIRLGKVDSPIIFEAGTVSKYPTLAAFENRILHNRFKYNGPLRYTSSMGTHFTFSGNLSKAPQVNGKGVGYNPPMVFNSPFMKSKFGSGKITITKGSHSASYDFSNYKAPVKTIH